MVSDRIEAGDWPAFPDNTVVGLMHRVIGGQLVESCKIWARQRSADCHVDFTSHHLDQVAVDLKFRAVFSLPGQPRGRGKVERYMNTINQMSTTQGGPEDYA